MRHTTRLLTIFVASLLVLTPVYSAEQPLDNIIAVVNDDIILATDFERERNSIVRQKLPNVPSGDQLDKMVFERLIIQSLQLQQAKLRAISVDDSNLQRTLDDMARNNNLSLSGLRERLANDGIDFLEFRENIRKQMIISTLMQREIESNLRVSDEEVEDFLRTNNKDAKEQYELDHILVKLPQQADTIQRENALNVARQIASSARDGINPADLVSQYQGSDGLAVEGGSLGWRTASDLPDLFAGQLPGMQQDDVSEPLRSPAGYHVLKLIGKRQESKRQVKRTRARHILASTRDGSSKQQALDKIERIRTLLVEGRTFESLAAEFSDDKSTGVKGGDLGWFGSGEMVPVFQRKAFSEPLNTISEPFLTQFGWHVLEVLEREYRELDSTNAADQVREKLRRDKAEEKFQQWLEQLRDDAYVELRGFGKNFQ